MTVDEALAVLDQACARMTLTRSDHALLSEALVTLKEATEKNV